MKKEIERKWICLPNDKIKEICHKEVQNIKDYYFNPYTRLRIVNDDKYYITIKNSGTLVRDEFEFEINPKIIDFELGYALRKDRYKFEYEKHIFEINVFQDITHRPISGFTTNLIIAECELDYVDEDLIIPEFFGKEVTEERKYYGWNLFNKAMDQLNKVGLKSS